jgi:hypothetical protein
VFVPIRLPVAWHVRWQRRRRRDYPTHAPCLCGASDVVGKDHMGAMRWRHSRQAFTGTFESAESYARCEYFTVIRTSLRVRRTFGFILHHYGHASFYPTHNSFLTNAAAPVMQKVVWVLPRASGCCPVNFRSPTVFWKRQSSRRRPSRQVVCVYSGSSVLPDRHSKHRFRDE